MGIEQVRILALWSRIAPNHAEGAYDWTALDHAVDRVVAAGMEPMLNITGPGPLWVSRRSERGEPRYDPDPKLYGEFARAVAERYGDRVDRYILWNEPNLGGWLLPQASCVGKRCTSVAPHLYRSLVRSAYPAVHDADTDAEVLIGALASRGRRAAPRERQPPPARVPARVRLRRREVQEADHRPLPRLPARDRRRLRVPPARRPDRARDAVPATRTTSRSRRSRG